MDSKFKDINTSFQIKQALYINSDQDILLEKIGKGDKAAFAEMVVHWRIYITLKISKEKYKKLLRADLVNNILNNGVIKLIEEKAEYVAKVGKLKSNWQIQMVRDIDQAIEDTLELTNDKHNLQEYDTPERITFLNKLNHLLRETEHEIIDRAIVCLETGEKKLRDNDPFTVDYNVEVKVNYFLKNNDYPFHSYWDFFRYDSTIIEKYYGGLLSELDWHYPEDIWPELDERYCYLMHDFLHRSNLYDKIFELHTIEIDIIETDHKGIMIKKDGSLIRLKFD